MLSDGLWAVAVCCLAPEPHKVCSQSLLGLQGSTEAPLEVANRGAIRFYPRSADSCSVKLTISYEVCTHCPPCLGSWSWCCVAVSICHRVSAFTLAALPALLLTALVPAGGSAWPTIQTAVMLW